ncbi:ATP/GTP-binding protein [Rhodospirillaceae bacterium KN72]|uniref:ATP/GTP-binding protein n=1 Tax=Pacificispira spongiicola TaxID=2729598 RepID=A0A7Y0E3K2_9PROT|nr:ATP/GTP-binding protein [Pacificispira spongiicola]NMM46617.1 ATP/GTP-binding protein [Pacificispira spongiicola]
MKRKHIFKAVAAAIAIWTAPQAAPAAELWRIEGLATPESALFDTARNRIVVSNINGSPGDADGNGFLSLVTVDGHIDTLHWVDGFDAPKGMAMVGDRLFVADLTVIREVDVTSGTLVASYPVEGAQFLNDVTASEDGSVYVSDMTADTIYRLKDGIVESWLRDARLNTPNGLAADGNTLFVGSWGPNMHADFSTDGPGGLIAIDLASKAITDVHGAEAAGNIDGVVLDGDTVFMTDYMKGVLLRLDADGTLSEVARLEPGSADLGGSADTLFIPMMFEGGLIAFTPDP